MDQTVLVTGIRGMTGVALAGELASRGGVEVRGGSSDPSRVALPGVTPVRFSWDHPAGWAEAAAGVDAVYLVRPDRPDAPELVGELLAVLPSSARVVLLSERHAEDVGEDVGEDGWAVRVERVVRDDPHPWTVLRPSWFMQVLLDPRYYRDEIADDARLTYSSGGARLAWIDARDIATVAATALLEDGHAGATYELSGPESLTLSETVAVLGGAIGREVTHREVSREEAVEGLEGFDLELTRITFQRVHEGRFAEVTDAVERVTGTPPRRLTDFAAEHAEVWRTA